MDYSDLLDHTALQAIWPQRYGCAITIATWGTYGWDSHVAMLFFIMLAVLIPLIGYIVYRCTPQKPETPAFAVFHPGYEFSVQGDGPGKCAYCNISGDSSFLLTSIHIHSQPLTAHLVTTGSK